MLRETCVVCGSGRFYPVYTFNNFPVYMGISDHTDIKQDIMSNMSWVICKHCGCIQLKNLLDINIVYHKGHNSAYGKTWEKHHRDFANFINKYCGNNLLEIGGGNLKLAELLTSMNNNIKFTVFDTNCVKTKNNNIITIEEFFDYTNYKIDYEIDTIIHSHVLEHFYNPIDYMKTFSKMLKEGQRMIMSVPLLYNMVEHKFTNSLNFEHTYMLDETSLYYMINRAGFKVVTLKPFNSYNVFVVCEKNSESARHLTLYNNYDRNLDTFNDFIKFHKNFVNKINNMPGKDFYVFGGHIFTQYLFAFGLNPYKFKCVLDNDPKKIDKRLYGTDLFVRSPKILTEIDKPVVVLRAAQFSKEIKKDIIENINNKTIFIEE